MKTGDWRELRQRIADLLFRRTGQTVDQWNDRVRQLTPPNREFLEQWLTDQGVTGYPRMLLANEYFGYPDFLTATADELIDGQYASRPHLRPILDAVLVRAAELGEVTIQARKGYVSLVGPRRTFATVQASTRQRVDLGLRISSSPTGGRVRGRSGLGSTQMTARIPLASVEEVDDEVAGWLRRAYEENA